MDFGISYVLELFVSQSLALFENNRFLIFASNLEKVEKESSLWHFEKPSTTFFEIL